MGAAEIAVSTAGVCCNPAMTRKIAAIVAAAALAAGCSSSTGMTSQQASATGPASATAAPAAPPAARGVEAAIGAVPWTQVGPGWLLATWSQAIVTMPGEERPPNEPSPETSTATLYLVDPAGGRYPVTTFPPPGENVAPELVDWSGDGGHALFRALSATSTAIVVDLRTGTQKTLTVNGFPRFTRPGGKALLVSSESGPDSRAATLERVDLAGNTELTYPTDKLGSTFNGQYLSTPDGTRLVLGTSAGLVLMGNDGAIGATLSIPDQADCRPVRWWDAGRTVLATCTAGDGSYETRLWLVPIDGGSPTALTRANNGQGGGQDLGDINAWQLPTGTFVQALGACGFIYLAKLQDDGTTTPVQVPGVRQGKSVKVIGVDGAALDVRAEAACGGGQSLLRYDSAANTSTVLLGPPLNGGGVSGAVPYAGQE